MFSNGCWNGRTQSGRVVEHVAVHHGIRAGEMSLRPVQEQRNVDRRVRARQWELRWNCYAMVMAEVARPAEEPKRTEQAHDRDQPRGGGAAREADLANTLGRRHASRTPTSNALSGVEIARTPTSNALQRGVEIR